MEIRAFYKNALRITEVITGISSVIWIIMIIIFFAYSSFMGMLATSTIVWGNFKKLWLNLSVTATLGTEESGRCRQVASVERFKQESI